MKTVIEISNLSIRKQNQDLLKNISLIFYEGINTFICGTSSSGKTLLLKAIDKRIKYKGHISIYEKTMVLFDKLLFTTELVEDELKYLSLNSEQKEFVSLFFSESELHTDPNKLSFYQQKLLIMCSWLWNNPKVIIIDNILSFLKERDLKIFLDYFKKHKITVISVLNDIEEALDYEYMIVLDKGSVAIEGKTLQVLNEEKILKRLGIGLPFYVDLSIQLKCYNLINKIYLNKEELVDKLWK